MEGDALSAELEENRIFVKALLQKPIGLLSVPIRRRWNASTAILQTGIAARSTKTCFLSHSDRL
jgi:hypothetical protein